MTLFQAAGQIASSTLTVRDVERARKLRDKAEKGGGVWQSWQRIVEALEAVLIIQEGVAEQGGNA